MASTASAAEGAEALSQAAVEISVELSNSAILVQKIQRARTARRSLEAFMALPFDLPVPFDLP